MILVYERSIFLRHERRSEWLQCMTLDSLILVLSSMDTNENKQTRFMCITETAFEILCLDHDKKQIEREKQVELPGRALRARLSNESWGDSKVLILTHKTKE